MPSLLATSAIALLKFVMFDVKGYLLVCFGFLWVFFFVCGVGLVSYAKLCILQ